MEKKELHLLLCRKLLEGKLTDFWFTETEVVLAFLIAGERYAERLPIPTSLEEINMIIRQAQEKGFHGESFVTKDGEIDTDKVYDSSSVMVINHEKKHIHDFHDCFVRKMAGDLSLVVTLSDGMRIPMRSEFLPGEWCDVVWWTAIETFCLNNQEAFFRRCPDGSLEKIKPEEISEADSEIVIISENHPGLSSVYMAVPFVQDYLKKGLGEYTMYPGRNLLLVKKGKHIRNETPFSGYPELLSEYAYYCDEKGLLSTR